MPAHRLLAQIRNLHAGQLAVLWAGSLTIAAFLIHAHVSVADRISTIQAATLASITAPRSYRVYSTPEQVARADSFDAALRAQSYRFTETLKTKVLLIELALAFLAASMLAVTWHWFGGRRPISIKQA